MCFFGGRRARRLILFISVLSKINHKDQGREGRRPKLDAQNFSFKKFHHYHNILFTTIHNALVDLRLDVIRMVLNGLLAHLYREAHID